jgi:heme exporter protein C
MNMRRVETGLGWVASGTMLVALFLIFCVVPTEAEMGDVQRIFYFHVPCAFAAYGLPSRWRARCTEERLRDGRPPRDRRGRGACLCTLVLVTGPIWAAHRGVW